MKIVQIDFVCDTRRVALVVTWIRFEVKKMTPIDDDEATSGDSTDESEQPFDVELDHVVGTT